MKTWIGSKWPIIFVLFVFVMAAGCSDAKKGSETAVGANSVESLDAGQPSTVTDAAAQNIPAGDLAVTVDGKHMTKAELDKAVKEKFELIKKQVPADKQKAFRENLRKQLVDVFVMKTLLANEVEKRKIVATDQDVKAAMNQIKASLPPNKNVDDFLKENKISKEDIILAVKIDKFRNAEGGKALKPTEKDINKFYNDNREKLFVEPESVHVRHILVSVGKDDSEKVKAEKKAKIDDLRKQLVGGANFAEIAGQHSDCPSKQAGGDLNFIRRGQMVKAFEDAAFAQEKNAIGPVIKTEYGYHIVQVLDRRPAKKIALSEVKSKIADYLERQKKMEAFNNLMAKLKAQAKITVY